MLDLTITTLEGRSTRLEPLSRRHADDLSRVAFDKDLWRFTPTQIHTWEDLDAYLEAALAAQLEGAALPFAIVDRSTGRAIGSTRLGNIDPGNRRVEIGWSWLGRDYQRKVFNTEAKLLLLAHAFDRLDCIRVEFKVDVLNGRSRVAVERLGARREGVLRHHMILPDGRLIDWVYYSILVAEWPSVRSGLEQRLAAHRSGIT